VQNLGDDLSKVVFKRVEHVNPSDYNLDLVILNIAWAMDGKRPLSVIAQEDHYDLKDLLEKATQLLELGVIEVSQSDQSVIDQEFVDILAGQLSKYLGPISTILIADTAKGLGYPLSHFPTHKLKHFIDLLAEKIQRQADKVAFRHVMEAMVQKKNY
jgi:hypothetical protein